MGPREGGKWGRQPDFQLRAGHGMGQLLTSGPYCQVEVPTAETGTGSLGTYRELPKLRMAPLVSRIRAWERKPGNIKWPRRHNLNEISWSCSEMSNYSFLAFSLYPLELRTGAEEKMLPISKVKTLGMRQFKTREAWVITRVQATEIGGEEVRERALLSLWKWYLLSYNCF